MALLTVFTPAYNRASTLPRTYQSLCEQECKDFINWFATQDHLGKWYEEQAAFSSLKKVGRTRITDLRYSIFIKKTEECTLLIM